MAAKLLRLVDARTRRLFVGLLLLFLASSALDSLGIACVFFLLKADTGYGAQLCALLLAGFAAKAGVQVAAIALRLHIEAEMRTRLGADLLLTYLCLPATEHQKRGFAILVRNVHSNVTLCVQSLLAAIDLAGDILLALALCATLLYLQPLAALVAVGVFGLFGGLYGVCRRGRFRGWGQAANEAASQMYVEMTASLTGVEAVQSLIVERYFADRYRQALALYGALNRKSALAQQGLRPLLELVLMALLLLPMMVLFWRGVPAADITPTLAVFAAVALRVLPSLSRGMGIIQQLRFGEAAIDSIWNDLIGCKDSASIQEDLSMAKGKGGTLLAGLTRKNPVQMAKGDPKMPTRSVNSDATRSGVAPSPKTLGPRNA